jgi:cytochrome c oxidase assembly protein subunit 15
MSVRRYRRLAVFTTVGICVLVVAGGVVRLTGSGLGCDDWPNCNDTRFIDVSSGHAAIEQLNRLLSGLIGVPTLALAVGSFFVRGRRGLRWPAIGVLVTVLANGVVGGIAVRGDLHPALVQSHFLLAMLSILFAVIAVRRAAEQPVHVVRPDPAPMLLGGLTFLALVTGTVVTGTGPHAGEEDVRRFGFDISNVARIHSVTVIAAIAAALWVAWRVRRTGEASAMSLLSGWIFVALLQGGVGYTQYFNGVPELLVGAHIALATGLWVITSLLMIEAVSAPQRQPEPDTSETLAVRFVTSTAAEV